jgi:uncharacterized protein
MLDWLHGIDWAHTGAIAIILIAGLAGVVLTLITLPGTWVAIGVALIIKVWQPSLFPWWVVGVAVVLALVGEAVEFCASALGAARGGATRRGAVGAIVGSIAGAILGSPLLFPIGTIAGGVIGAAAGTIIMERGAADRTWKDATRAGTGAAAGRLVATVAKTGIACAIALLLAVSVFFK